MKDSKNYVIAALCLVLCIMAVGFAAFSSTLNINSTATISSNWNVKFATNGDTGVTFTDPTQNSAMTAAANYSACEASYVTGGEQGTGGTITTTGTLVTMTADLKQPGDSVTCYAVITNQGSINAELDSLSETQPQDTTYVQFTSDLPAEGDALLAGAERLISITASYKDVETSPAANSQYSYTAVLNYQQKTS